jgi:hypothetical protein
LDLCIVCLFVTRCSQRKGTINSEERTVVWERISGNIELTIKRAPFLEKKKKSVSPNSLRHRLYHISHSLTPPSRQQTSTQRWKWNSFNRSTSPEWCLRFPWRQSWTQQPTPSPFLISHFSGGQARRSFIVMNWITA